MRKTLGSQAASLAWALPQTASRAAQTPPWGPTQRAEAAKPGLQAKACQACLPHGPLVPSTVPSLRRGNPMAWKWMRLGLSPGIP